MASLMEFIVSGGVWPAVPGRTQFNSLMDTRGVW
jgi:hypothetical protein